MAKFTRFEDIQAWQQARRLTREIYKITAHSEFASDFALRDQIRRAVISVMLNIAEGFARRSNKEFAQFLFVAHGSVAEVQSALYIAGDLNYITPTEFESLYQTAEEISKMLSGLIKYLRKQQ